MSASSILKVVLTLSICSSPCFAAISFHAQRTDAATSGSWTEPLPTVSNGDVVIAYVASASGSSNGLPPYADISGWTTYCSQNFSSIFVKTWHTGDATSITYVPQNGANIGGNQQTGGIVTYSGASGLDGVPNCQIQLSGNMPQYFQYILAPAVSPSSTNDVWVGIFGHDNSNFGFDITAPAGTNDRANANFAAPIVDIADKSLSSGANTGNFYATPPTNGGIPDFGASVLLKPLSGGSVVSTSVIPTLGGTQSFTGSAFNYGVGSGNGLFPQDGDLLVYVNCQNLSGVTASGWNTLYTQTGLTVLTLIWRTGGPTTLTPGGTYNSVNSTCNFIYDVRNYLFATNGQAPTVDAFEVQNTAGATITLGSMAISSTDELLVAHYIDQDSDNPQFSVPTNLNYVMSIRGAALGSGHMQASQITPANPTGSFASTNSNSGTDQLRATLLAFKLGGNVTAVRHRTVMIDQF